MINKIIVLFILVSVHLLLNASSQTTAKSMLAMPNGFIFVAAGNDPTMVLADTNNTASAAAVKKFVKDSTPSYVMAAMSITKTSNPTSFNQVTGVINIYTPTSYSVTNRPIDSSTFVISSLYPASVNYFIQIDCTSTIVSSASGSLTLQYSMTGSAPWTDCGIAKNANSFALAVTLQGFNSQVSCINWNDIPAGATCRLKPTKSGTTTITFLKSQEKY